MKKILFLLLFTSAMYGQIVPTGQEQDFDYGIKNTASQLDDNAVFITVQNSDGVQGKSTSSVWAKKIYVDNADVKKSFLSTGLIKNGLVQANADPTKFNITAGIGIISNFDDPENPTSTIVNFPAFTGITPTYLTTSNITYIAINSSATIVQQATPFTNIQRRDLIALGAVIHSNLTTINLINNISAPTNADTNQLHDLMEAIGALNVDGNKITANGANLSINKTAGDIFKLGVNFANDWKNPHKLNISAQTPVTFRYRTQNGTEGSNVTALNPALYDVANVLTSVPSNKFSIQTVTLFQTGAIRVQYGQATYATLSEAESAINTRTYNVEPNIAANGITRAYIILKNTATSLQNASDTKIVEAGKFGNVSGSGGAITLDAIVAALGFTPENVANKSDSYTVSSSTTYASTKALVDGLATKINITEKGVANGVATLGTDGKVPNSQIPALAISETFPVASQSAMLGLSTAEQGDVAVRTDISKSFILTQSPASTLSNWQELLTPTDAIQSVDGQVGNVNLATSYAPLSGSANYIQNQNVSAQSANMWISGTGKFGAILTDNTGGGYWQSMSGATNHFIIGSENNVGGGSINDLSYYSYNGIHKFYQAINGTSATFSSTVTASNGTLIGGTGTTNRLSKFTGASVLGDSGILDNSTVNLITLNSSNQIEVKGTSTLTNAQSLITNSDTDFNFYASNSSGVNKNINFLCNGSSAQAMRITSGGNVLIGTTTDNGVDKVQVNGTITAFPAVSPNQVPVLSQVATLTGNQTIAGIKTFSSTPLINSGALAIYDVTDESYVDFSIDDRDIKFSQGGVPFVRFNSGIIEFGGSSFSKSYVTTPKNWELPNASGTVALISQTVTNGNTASSPSEDAVYDFVQANTRPYKVYTALLSQSGTSAPTATVLENTLGTVVWTYNTTGQYVGTLSNAFPVNKTFAVIQNNTNQSGGYSNEFSFGRFTDSTLFLNTQRSDSTSTGVNGLLYYTSIEIRVYN